MFESKKREFKISKMELSYNSKNVGLECHRTDMIYIKNVISERYHCQRPGCSLSYENASGLAKHMKKHFKEDKRTATRNKRLQATQSEIKQKCFSSNAYIFQHTTGICNTVEIPFQNRQDKRLHLSKREIKKRNKKRLPKSNKRKYKKKKEENNEETIKKSEKQESLNLRIQFPFPSYVPKEYISKTKNTIHVLTANMLSTLQKNEKKAKTFNLIKGDCDKNIEEEKRKSVDINM